MFDKDYSENQSQAAEGSESAANTETSANSTAEESSESRTENAGETGAMGNSSINAGSTGNNNANAETVGSNGSYGQAGNGSSYGQSSGNYSGQSSYGQTGSSYSGQNSYGQAGGNYSSQGSYSSYGQAGGSYSSQNGYGQGGYSSYGQAGGNYSGQNGYGQQYGGQQSGPNYYNGAGQNNQSRGGYGQYQSNQSNYQYGSGDYGRNTANNQNTNKSKKDKKSASPFWKKAVALTVSAVCFGVIAGASFLAVSSFGTNREAAAAQGTAVVEKQEVNNEIASAKEEIKTTTKDGTVTAVVTDVTEVVERTMPSIVSITNQTITSVADFWGQTYEREESSAGSGIIIGQNDTELLIVTNNHVVDGSDKLSVKFIDDEVVEALTKGTNASMDLAVIAVKLDDIGEATMNSISIATMGDSDSLKVGEPVIAIGNALGYGQSVTTGVVSALNRVLEMSETGTSNALIQTDAAINPGNSGGALLDINGNVIGINSNKIGGSTIEGMGYAIPISSAKPIIEDLMNRETRERVEAANRGYLGISCINVNASMSEAYGMPEGILIAQIYPGTGADNAGLVKGDVIVGFNGDEVTSQDDLLSAMEYFAVGDTVDVTIMRGNITDGYEEMVVEVTLTSQEAMNVENQ